MNPSVLLFEHPRIPSESHYNDVANAPLSACLMSGYIAAALRQHDVPADIYEAYLADKTCETCFAELTRMDFDFLGVHAVYFWEHTPELFRLLKRVKESKPEVPVVLYGFFPTFAWRQILETYDCVDAVVVGEPEETFVDLLDAYARRGSGCFATVAGIARRAGDDIVLNPPRPLIERLDDVPMPCRSDLFTQSLGGVVLGSRGCYNACTFCCIPPFYGDHTCRRGRSPENIVTEIEALLPRLSRKYIYFLDANFFGKGDAGQKRALDIANRLRVLNIEFGLECRCNDVTEETFGLLAEAGLRDVFLGIENVVPSVLKRMKKGAGETVTARALGILRKNGIEPNAGFIMFEPDSDLADVRRNYAFLSAHNLLNQLETTANVLYHREIVLRGMQHFDELEGRGRFVSKDSLHYEGCYRFVDPSVQFLADLMSVVCRRVLRAMEHHRSPICWRNTTSSVSQRVNEYVRGFFDTVLQRLEKNDISCTDDALQRLENEALDFIEGLIVEERVCQS